MKYYRILALTLLATFFASSAYATPLSYKEMYDIKNKEKWQSLSDEDKKKSIKNVLMPLQVTHQEPKTEQNIKAIKTCIDTFLVISDAIYVKRESLGEAIQVMCIDQGHRNNIETEFKESKFRESWATLSDTVKMGAIRDVMARKKPLAASVPPTDENLKKVMACLNQQISGKILPDRKLFTMTNDCLHHDEMQLQVALMKSMVGCVKQKLPEPDIDGQESNYISQIIIASDTFSPNGLLPTIDAQLHAYEIKKDEEEQKEAQKKKKEAMKNEKDKKDDDDDDDEEFDRPMKILETMKTCYPNLINQ